MPCPSIANLPATTGETSPGSQIQTKASASALEVITHRMGSTAHSLRQQGQALVRLSQQSTESLLVSIKQPQPDDGGQLKGSANLGGHLAAFDALQSAA